MYKKILCILLMVCIASPCFGRTAGLGRHYHQLGDPRSNELSAIRSATNGGVAGADGLTFYANYEEPNSSIDAFYSVGSPTATFTRSATNDVCTSIDASGVIQVESGKNAPRFVGGYYDSTGFHAKRGLLIEAAGTNLLKNSQLDINSAWGDGVSTDNLRYGASNYWYLGVNTGGSTATTVNTIGTDSIFPYSAKIEITNAGASSSDIQFNTNTSNNTWTMENATVYTVSFWVKADASKTIPISVGEFNDDFTNYGLNSTFATVANTWVRITKTFTSNTGGSVTDAAIYIKMGNLGTFSIAFYGFQLEASPYATSFIPTTTAAATRNAETLKYAIAGNRTAAQETIAIKFAPESTFANDGISRYLLSSDTKLRNISKSNVSANTILQPNASDNGSCYSLYNSANFTANNTTAFCGVLKHTSPYVAFYLNGSAVGTDETTDNFTDPAWGSDFEVGCSSTGTLQVNGIIQKICFWEVALSSGEVLATSTILGYD